MAANSRSEFSRLSAMIFFNARRFFAEYQRILDLLRVYPWRIIGERGTAS